MLDRLAANVVASIDTVKATSIKKLKREDGASAVEYGLLVAAIAAVIVVVVFGLGALVRNGFSSTSQVINDSAQTP
jgi:pilus assembly protein Flp/PilA